MKKHISNVPISSVKETGRCLVHRHDIHNIALVSNTTCELRDCSKVTRTQSNAEKEFQTELVDQLRTLALYR